MIRLSKPGLLTLLVLAGCAEDVEQARPYTGPAALVDGIVNRDQGGAPQNETTISVDPGDHNRIAAGWNDYRSGDTRLGFGLSQDGGKTWVDGLIDEPNHAAQGDPAVASASDGTHYMAMISFERDNNEGGIYVAATAQDGRSFQRAVRVAANPNIFEDKEYIAVDNSGASRDGTVYVSWTDFDDVRLTTQIVLSRSEDRGKTWSNPQPVTRAVPFSEGFVQGSMPAVGNGGRLYITYFEDRETFAPDRFKLGKRNQGPPHPQSFPWRRFRTLGAMFGLDPKKSLANHWAAWQVPLPIPNRLPERSVSPAAAADVVMEIRLVASEDGGRSFEAPVIVAQVKPTPFLDFRSNSFPSIAIARQDSKFTDGETIHIGWAGGVRDIPPFESDVFVATSRDRGRSFSAPRRVNDDPPGIDQIFPWIATDQTGVLHAIWYDRRDDPARRLLHLYSAKSTDGGQTFSANRRVTDAPSNPDTDFGGTFFGDYNGLAAAGGRGYALWTDSRNGGQDAFYSNLD